MVLTADDHARTGVLVVDDDRSIAEVVRQALTDEGYAVRTASDGLEALEDVAAEPPALVVLDLMMPRLDGFGFLDRLRETPVAQPSVIVLSARSGPDDIAQAIDRGASDFLTKPFDLEELLLRVRLRLARASREHAAPAKASERPTGLEIQTFGGLRLLYEGQPMLDENWRHRNAKRLFKHLFTQRGQRLSKEKIVASLWPDLDQEAGVNNLRVTVHVLRQTLAGAMRELHAGGSGTEPADVGRDVLLQQHGFYWFNTEADYWSDVDAFERHIGTARELATGGDVAGAAAQYAEAMALYRGPYLAEDLYDEPVSRERERLHQDYVAAAADWMSLEETRGDLERAIEIGRQVLRLDVGRETVYRLLMRYLARLGRRDEAMHLYRRAVDALQHELGVQPVAETRELYDRIRSGASV